MTLQHRITLSWALMATALVFLLFLHECTRMPCKSEITAIERVWDTMYVDRPVTVNNIRTNAKKRYKAAKALPYIYPFDTAYREQSEQQVQVIAESKCDSVRVYVDSVNKAGQYSAVITDTVLGIRTGLGISFKNITPEIRETINIPAKKQSLIKVYLGVIGAGGKNYWSLMPSGQMIFKDRFALQYAYDARFNRHQAGAFVKISFKK